MTAEKAIQPYQETKLAPVNSLRVVLRPLVASAAESLVEATKRAPELADEVVGLVRALKKYLESKTDQEKEG